MQPPAIEIDEVHARPRRTSRMLCALRSGVAHAEIVEGADACGRSRSSPGSESDARRAAARASDSQSRMRSVMRSAVYDDAVPPVARSDRRGHGQARAMQVIDQLPLRERAGLLLAAPEIPVPREAGDEPAAPVVPQHQPRAAVQDEMHGAAAAGLALELAALPPVVRIEPRGRQIAGPGGVI